MAQIIKHRRGSLESLSAVTSSLQKGEIVIASGSSNLSVTNGSSLVFSVPENGQVQAINRFLIGNAAPSTFAASTYNGMVNGVPYYDSGSGTLYLLGSDGNTAINLVGNIQPFSQSVDSRLVAVEGSLGGGGSIGSRVSSLESSSIALAQFTGSQETKNSTLATYTGSVDSKFTEIGNVTSSLISSASSAAVSISNLNSFTQSFSQSVATDFSASAASVSALSASVASVTGNFSSSVATSFSASAASVAALSQSVATSFGNVAGEQSAQDARLGSLEAETSSYARKDSANVFNGTQVITGSLFITQDLVVYGSSSLLNVTASRLDLGDNTIVLNTATPAVRFAGIDVIDSGSSQSTGSLYWDSLNNHWLYVHPSGASEGYNSAIFIAGPKNTGSLGEEIGLTSGKIPVAQGEDHIEDSIMTQSGGNKISIAGGLDVIGEVSASTINGIGNVAAFSQSVDSRLDTIETSLGGGGSIGARVTAIESFTGSQETKNGTLATYTASVDSKFAEVGISTASLNTFSASANSRLTSIESFTGSQETKNGTLATYTASVDSKLNEIHSFTSSVNTKLSTLATYTASIDNNISNIHSFTSSQDVKNGTLATYTASVDSKLSSIHSFTSSQETKNSTLATYTASVDSKLSQLEVVSSSLISTASAHETRINALALFTGSYATTGSNTFIGTQTVSGSVNVSGSTNFNGAVAVNDSNMNLTNSSSLNLTSGSSIYVNGSGVISGSIVGIGNVSAFSQSVDSRLDTLESAVGGGSNIDTRLTNLELTSASHDGRLDSLESYSSSLKSALTVTGADVVVIGNLKVNGTTTTVDSTTIQLGDNIIELNGTGAANGGLLVKDPTAPNTISGSLLWDSTNDYWKAGALGSESKLLRAAGDSVVTGSSQIDITATTGYSTFSSSVESSISASNASLNTTISSVSSSLDGRLDVLEGTGTIQGVGTTNSVSFTAVSASLNVPTVSSGNASSKRVAFRNTNGNIDFAPSASVAGDLLQWDGNDFVMSNVIDGGSF